MCMSMKAGRPSSPIKFIIMQGVSKMENQSNNPMHPERLTQSPRCLARTRSGTECQSPAVHGRKRCRMHGGTNPGAPAGNRNAWKHGSRSAETIALLSLLREFSPVAG
ncbi:HGGxSTG domain-containing protein [Sphingomonas sp.]|uniref:HGGxSTG domain-containing protein n=1 Tax=Sphingomonas sp. TaxID=28214 RepID=UPI00386E5578